MTKGDVGREDCFPRTLQQDHPTLLSTSVHATPRRIFILAVLIQDTFLVLSQTRLAECGGGGRTLRGWGVFTPNRPRLPRQQDTTSIYSCGAGASTAASGQ